MPRVVVMAPIKSLRVFSCTLFTAKAVIGIEIREPISKEGVKHQLIPLSVNV